MIRVTGRKDINTFTTCGFKISFGSDKIVSVWIARIHKNPLKHMVILRLCKIRVRGHSCIGPNTGTSFDNFLCQDTDRGGVVRILS